MVIFQRLPPSDLTSLDDIITQYPVVGWPNLLEEVRDMILHAERKILDNDKVYYPYPNEVFMALYLTPVNRVKAVIIGQSPYHSLCQGLPQAFGLSFAVRRGVPPPPSLRAVYTELTRSIPDWIEPNHGDLSAWAGEGVLLLNQCLTVKPNDDTAHGALWLGVVKTILERILQTRPDTVFMLWGRKAQGLKKYLVGANILEAGHPSPLNSRDDFTECDHFNKANAILTERGHTAINWHLPR